VLRSFVEKERASIQEILCPAHNPHDESDNDNCSEDAADIHMNLRYASDLLFTHIAGSLSGR
jgi:hypothetical protein